MGTLRYGPPRPNDFAYNQKGQKIPGFKQFIFTKITVPNAQNDAGEGTSTYPSVEAWIQECLQGWVATFSCQTFTDQFVAELIRDRAEAQAAYNQGLDPGSSEIDNLVKMYTAIYRNAVTPIT